MFPKVRAMLLGATVFWRWISPKGASMSDSNPHFKPLVEACLDHGICRTVAFNLSRRGLLSTFLIGKRRYVRLESLRTLPERLAPAGGDK